MGTNGLKNRALVGLLKKRLQEPQPLMQVLIGPRQVGKTTAVKAVLGPTDHYHTADYPAMISAQQIEKWWLEAHQQGAQVLVIDEVQKIIDWSSMVKKLYDTVPKLKLILTGSSALLMERGLKESLTGRFELIQAEHWNYQEAHEILGLNVQQFIEWGCYPGAHDFLSDALRWGEYIRNSIVEPILGRDLMQLHPVKHPALLRQVFSMAAHLPAHILSLQKIQGQLQTKGSLTTLQHYLQLLEQSFLVTGVEKYSSSFVQVKKSSPKLIVHDNALVKAFERPVDVELTPERRDWYFENAVGARLIEAGWQVFYWKHKQLEVDFVVLGPGGEKLALEVKSSQAKNLEGLRVFCQQNPDFTPVLVALQPQSHPYAKVITAEKVLSLSRQKPALL